MSSTFAESKLNSIGSSFFISYLYGKYIDENEKRWMRRPSDQSHTIEACKVYYLEMIDLVLKEEASHLNTNQMNIPGVEVLKMAQELKDMFTHRSALSLHIKSNSFISFSDFSDVIKQTDEAIQFIEETSSSNTQTPREDARIVQFRNGSIIIELLVSVTADLISTALLRIVKLIREKIGEKQKDERSVFIEENVSINQININIQYNQK